MLFSCLATGLFASQDKKQVRIRLQAQTGYFDETSVYFDQGIASGYTVNEDAPKLYSGLANVPTLFTLTSDNVECSINGYSTLTNSEIVPLGVIVDNNGVYKFTCPILDNFDGTSIIQLEDRDSGVFIDLRVNFYQVQLDTNAPSTGRFFLHVSTPAVFNTTVAGCTNDDGVISVQQDNSVRWTECNLYDMSNVQMGQFRQINGQFNFGSLAEGDYYMVFIYNQYTTTRQFHVPGHHIVSGIAASTLNAYTTQDIDFHAQSTNANHFEWDFGEGTWIVGVANPTLAYYEPGVYNVTLKATNDYGCSANSDVTVYVSQISGINDVESKNVIVSTIGKTITVNLNDEIKGAAKVNIYNLLGANIYNGPVNSTITHIGFDEQPAGYYLVSVTNNNKTNTSRVYLGQ